MISDLQYQLDIIYQTYTKFWFYAKSRTDPIGSKLKNNKVLFSSTFWAFFLSCVKWSSDI